MVKLYLPYGKLKTFSGPRHLTFHWFRRDRAEPIGVYTDLILDYRHLSDEKRQAAEAAVDEFFTEEEFYVLREYLYKAQGEDLRTGILVPPVGVGKQDSEARLGLTRPFRDCLEGAGGGFCKLSEQEGYSLPFSVWGYYTEPSRLLYPRAAAATPVV